MQRSTWNQVTRWLGLMLVVCLIAGRSLPAAAQSRIDPKLREQVLQIIRENPEAILEAVQAYQQQQQQKQQQARQAFLESMKTNPKALIGQSPTQGTGRVLLVEFSDFQCPFCAKAQETVKQFVAKHPDRVTFVYKHLPLTAIHAEALAAAKAAWAAGQQGKFWEYHDALFQQQSQLGAALYSDIAKSLKLDLARFDRDRASSAATAAIEQDVQLADRLGVEGTPFFVMNGEAVSGSVELSELEAILTRASK